MKKLICSYTVFAAVLIALPTTSFGVNQDDISMAANGVNRLIANRVMAAPTGAGTSLNYVPGEVLVVPKQLMQMQGSFASMGMSVIIENKGITPFVRLKLPIGQSVQGVMNTLAAQPWVAHVQPNYIHHVMATPNDPRFSQYWGLNNAGQTVNTVAGVSGADISAIAAWNETTNCSSVTVAVIDSGVDYNHPDLAANVWANAGEVAGDFIDNDANGFVDDIRGWDFVQGDNDPMDFNVSGHGTHVAGTIGAVGNNGIGGTGVCWAVKIMPLRAANSIGRLTTASEVAAVDYAVANGAKVINASFGGTGGTAGDLMDLAIANANAAGVIFVAAAGNSGTNNDTTAYYPVNYNQPNIISVAATDQNDAKATFSNFGATTVDVGAPGTNISSSTPPARVNVCGWNFDTATLEGWTPTTFDNLLNPLANTVGITTEAALSPLYSLTDSPGTLYANNREYRATSPVCDLTGQQGAVLSYALMLDTELGLDGIFLEHSSNGVAWTNPFGSSGWTGSTGGAWIPSTSFGGDGDLQVLDGMATSQVRFRMKTNASVIADGMHLDDIAITVPGTVHAGTEYGFLNGTSMATPHVAGLAALVWAADPTLTNLQLRSRILNNGDLLAALVGTTASGRRINAKMSMPLHPATAVAATVASATQVNLSWTDNSISEQNYLVQRSAGGAFTTIATLAAGIVSYSDTAAPAGTMLSYRVVAQGRDARTSISVTANATTAAAPAAPAGGGGSFGSILILLGLLCMASTAIRRKVIV